MRKFRAGDKVRLLSDNTYGIIYKGCIGIILEAKHDSSGWLLVRTKHETYGMEEYDTRWELINPKSWKEKMSENI